MGGLLGAIPLGAFVLGAAAVPAIPFQPAWAANVNAVVQATRIDP